MYDEKVKYSQNAYQQEETVMKIYDISQEVFSCGVYPGDPKPEKQTLCAIGTGNLYNLTAFSMCAHNGTHIDAPFHFLEQGKTVDRMDLDMFVGDCWLARHDGPVTASARLLFLRFPKSLRKSSSATHSRLWNLSASSAAAMSSGRMIRSLAA